MLAFLFCFSCVFVAGYSINANLITSNATGNATIPCFVGYTSSYSGVNCTLSILADRDIWINGTEANVSNAGAIVVGTMETGDGETNTIQNHAVRFQNGGTPHSRIYLTDALFSQEQGLNIESSDFIRLRSTSSVRIEAPYAAGSFWVPSSTDDYLAIGDAGYNSPETSPMLVWDMNRTTYEMRTRLMRYTGTFARNISSWRIQPNATDIIVEKLDRTVLMNVSQNGSLVTFGVPVTLGTTNGLTAQTVTTTAGLINSGAIRWAISNKTANATLTSNEATAFVNTGALNRVITLPLVSGNNRIVYFVKKIDSGVGNVTINTSGTNLIDGGKTYNLTSLNQAVFMQNDISNTYYILGAYP